MGLFLSAIGWIVILWLISNFVRLATWIWVVIWFVIVGLMAANDAAQAQAKEDAKTLKKCRACAEDIKIDAIKCKHCGEMQT